MHFLKATLQICAACVFLTNLVHAQGNSNHAHTQSEGAGAPEIVPHRVNPQANGSPTAGSTGVLTPNITNHGGPVMNAPNVYLIWYGNWSQSNASDTPEGQQIVRDFLSGLSGSGYYQTNASYPGVSGYFSVLKEITDSYSQGSRLSDSKVQAIVSRAISSHNLPSDAMGVYFVLTSSDVAESSGFCSKYCGWHTWGTISGTEIKYSFVGNASRCPSACAAQPVGPNGNAGVDGMVSVIAHELEETNTDPDLNAWYDSKGAESADKCAWTFGSNQMKASNGAYYNMTLPGVTGSRNFLIQRQLDSNSKCYVDYSNNNKIQ
jgi:Phosphate-induced protein 1 conserved region